MIYAYKKALRVIDSCTNPIQLKGARNYVNNFFKVYSEPVNQKLAPFSLVRADDALVEVYNRLMKKLTLKEINMRNSW